MLLFSVSVTLVCRGSALPVAPRIWTGCSATALPCAAAVEGSSNPQNGPMRASLPQQGQRPHAAAGLSTSWSRLPARACLRRQGACKQPCRPAALPGFGDGPTATSSAWTVPSQLLSAAMPSDQVRPGLVGAATSGSLATLPGQPCDAAPPRTGSQQPRRPDLSQTAASRRRYHSHLLLLLLLLLLPAAVAATPGRCVSVSRHDRLHRAPDDLV